MSIGMPKSDMVVLERVTAKKRADYRNTMPAALCQYQGSQSSRALWSPLQ